MTAKQARPFARLVLAIVVGALIIGALVYAAFGTAKTITVTSTTTLTVQTGSTPSQARLYKVAFRQMGACSPTLFAVPSVTLGNQTLAEPSNASLPVQAGTASPQNPNDTITFSVPDGVYPYTKPRGLLSALFGGGQGRRVGRLGRAAGAGDLLHDGGHDVDTEQHR